MSAAACSSNGKCGVSEEVFRGTRVPQLAAAAVPVRSRNMGPASLTSAADFGKGSHPVSCLSLLSRPPEPAVEQAAAEKAASERSSSTTTAAEGPLSADACNSTSSDSAFLPTDQEHDLLRLSLAFTAARGSPSKAEFPRGAALSPSSSGAGKAPDMAALTAQLKCLDMQSGCGSASREHKDLKSINVPLQLQPPLTSPQSNRQKESSVASVEASAWAQTPVKEEDLVASRAPDESRPPQEVPRSRNKSCASTPAGGAGKSRAGDTEDQVYRLGLLLRQLGRLGRVRSCWEIWQEMMNTEGKPLIEAPRASQACVLCLFLTSHSIAFVLEWLVSTCLLCAVGLKPNAVSYGCIFDALVTNGALDLALKLLADMKASNQPVRPNTVMYSTLIKGCAQTKQAG
ncbi:LOW QUALITY PROTEIN: hypothetical protein, conserved [Eimeria necatrix]|uniref:PPR repeat-containing protein n=1 Tax=Eimeria necatrix TaxID=51315 RepID=U6MZ20_9EIME|nr:LOW QUALITY PROTEIN: hypothetical protein, conserved [Eimeria necatrix]CDJ69201.1 hypothetical protein, conserved [Eimeria necatrix]